MKNSSVKVNTFCAVIVVLSAFLSISHFSFSQSIPNGGFEDWIQEFYGEEPANWGELNMQLLGDYGTIVKSTDAIEGNFAMELNSVEANIFDSIFTFIPSVWLNLKNSNLSLAKFALDSHLTSLSGQIKLNLASGDSNSASIIIQVYNEGNLIALGAKSWAENVSEYDKFNIPVTYFENEEGDSIEVTITGGSQENPVVGNVMKLDDFKLNYGEIPKMVNVDFSVDMSRSIYKDSLIGLFHNFKTFWSTSWMTKSGNNDNVWVLSEKLPLGEEFNYIFAIADGDSSLYTTEWDLGLEPNEPCLDSIDRRILKLFTENDTTLATVCWESCDACQDSLSGNDASKEMVGFKVYPNPSDEILRINFSQSGSQKINMNIYSMVGQRVFSHEVMVSGANHFEFDLGNINPGQYIIAITNSDRIYSQRLIIQ